MNLPSLSLEKCDTKPVTGFKSKAAITVSSTVSTNATNRSQKSSLKQGLKEAISISQGKEQGTPLSELWDE